MSLSLFSLPSTLHFCTSYSPSEGLPEALFLCRLYSVAAYLYLTCVLVSGIYIQATNVANRHSYLSLPYYIIIVREKSQAAVQLCGHAATEYLSCAVPAT